MHFYATRKLQGLRYKLITSQSVCPCLVIWLNVKLNDTHQGA